MFLENWIPLQSFVEGETFEWTFCENLKELINDFKNMYHIDNIYKINLNKFILLLETYIEPLSCFGFIGIYTLINKANGGAYYSCGNARDVYDLIEIINPYIDKEQNIYKHIIEAKDIFKYSHLSGEPICIA